MNVYILNSAFEPVAVIDTFKSLIWTKRYYSYGDFELYIPADNSVLPFIQPDNFVIRDNDDSVMVIEKLQIITDAEDGNFFIVSGRSAESILLRRIFNRQYVLKSSSTINSVLANMLEYCTTLRMPDPYGNNDYRKLPVSINQLNPIPINGSIAVQFTGDTLLDAIISICKPREIGLKMTISNGEFLLTLYEGAQTEVVFSPDFDNMLNSKYVFDKTNYFTTIFVAGEGEGSARIWSSYLREPFAFRSSGLALREYFVDARGVSSNNGEISRPDYDKMLDSKAYEAMAQHDVTRSFEAEVETRLSFQYKTDYNLGDLVTVTNEYGVTAQPRIIEIIESWSETGYTVIPTFDALEMIEAVILRDSTEAILRDSSGAILTVQEG